jgi:DNA-binding NtrC family response regulator
MKSIDKILLIEDLQTTGLLYKEELEEAGFLVDWLTDGTLAMERICSGQLAYSLIITDYQVPGTNGMNLLKAMQKVAVKIPVIFLTAHGNMQTAIEAMREGAFDYLEKPVDLDQLIGIVREATEQTSRTLHTASIESAQMQSLLVGRSAPMMSIYKKIGRISATPATVLIRGETGTGKELVARTIHQYSLRAEKPFIAVNCAAIPENLLESELFGHEKGSFTGADKQRIGRFEKAQGGTLFLDEIGDMPMETQVKLLRVLQERRIQRLGSEQEIPIDVRIIAATHRSLESMIETHSFREDLYHRLAVAEIKLPSLAERADDIPLLVDHFLHRFSSEFGIHEPTIEQASIDFLQQQIWPGNIRQLQNTVRSALLQARHQVITLKLVKSLIQGEVNAPPKMSPVESSAHLESHGNPMDLDGWVISQLKKSIKHPVGNLRQTLIETLDRKLIDQALKMASNNRSKAARFLGVTRRTLRLKMEQFEMSVAELPDDEPVDPEGRLI